ncbi:MAG: hypothetical protein KA586_02120 [Candidatus Promineofilum sp.]|nr:hypothetical protein [Promineifilum sp.]
MRANRRLLPAAVFVLLLATFLRFHLLGAQSFWNDEGNSARLSERSIPAIVEGTASDVHPPFYYLALRGWRELLGETEFGLRALSAYAGVLTVATVMAVVRRGDLTPRRRHGQARGWEESDRAPSDAAGLALTSSAVAGLLAAVNPLLVYYSQETRMYALLALLAALSAWALLNWLGGTRRRLGWAAAYIVMLAAGLYTHYFFPAVIAAQGAVMALWWVRPAWVIDQVLADQRAHGRRLLAWAGTAAIAAMIYAPWVPVFVRQIGGRGGAPAGLAAFASAGARWLALGSTVGPHEATWAIVAFVALVTLGVAAGGRRSAVPLLLAAIPLVFMYGAGATDPAFFKFMLVAVPFLAVLMGLAWRSSGPGRIPALVLTVAVLTGSLLSLSNLYGDPAFARADYRGMAARIAAEAHPNAGIILVAPNQWEAFTYYHRDGAPVYPLPRGRPDPAIVEPELERIAAAHDRLYVLYWGDAQRDPEHIIERWLDSHTFKASEEWVADVRFAVYAVPSAAPAEATPSGAAFAGLDGGTITLHEFTVWPSAAAPGDVIQVRLVWSANAPAARPYKVFLHLLDAAGNVVAQRDGEPVGGSRPTTGWAAGERITDNHGLLLPSNLPTGRYSLRLGLYDAFDPQVRLIVGGQDGLVLGEIEVQ